VDIRQFLTTRKRNYQTTFAGVGGEAVLVDLARFCRADESTFNTDPRISALMEGRREVWLRITKHLNLSPDELARYFNPTGE
tara:strand:- start:2264 stop:2509 length:246 start_codon:yes stop_codon:yes gene_type:complete